VIDDTESDLPADLQPPPDDSPEPSGHPGFELPAPDQYEPAITDQLLDLGVDPTHTSVALDWLRANAGQHHDLTARRDRYNLDTRGFATDELGTLHHFLGRMHDAGIPEQTVAAMLDWYRDARSRAPAPAASAAPSRDTADKGRAIAELQRRWGHDYDSRIGQAQRYLSSLPRAQRESLVAQVLPNGVRALNDPSTITWLANQAHAATERQYPETVRMTSTDNRRIDEIENIMRTDRHRYDRDEAMQAEYRSLLAQREGVR
jgi:hypothetical protein